jgi:general secretion pathway protein J
MTRSVRSVGFSLIELLVAVALFAIASGLAYGGLDALARTRTQLDEQAEQWQALQFAVGLIERDVRASIDRPVRDAYGASLPALQLVSGRIELSRIGHANSLAQPRAEIERVSYQVSDGTLQRLRFAVLDRVPGSVPEIQPLLPGIERFELRAFGLDGRPQTQWPADRDTPGLPQAVELRIQIEGVGEVRRLLELAPGAPS